jgi:pyrroline-5-carboxylate reductase
VYSETALAPVSSVGFIGAGNIGFAMARAVASRFPGLAIHVYDPRSERLALLRKEIRTARTAAGVPETAAAAEVLFLAVKPQDMEAVLERIAETDRLVISIAAGITIERLERTLTKARVVRVMPNISCLVGAMAAGYAFGTRVQPADRRVVQALLGAAGYAAPLEERLLDAVTGLSGSGPAFVTRLIEAFIDAGVGLGLAAGVARELAVHTFLGTARLLSETGMEPAALVDMVSSPEGTTVAGREILEASDYRELIAGTITAAARRSKELGQ